MSDQRTCDDCHKPIPDREPQRFCTDCLVARSTVVAPVQSTADPIPGRRVKCPTCGGRMQMRCRGCGGPVPDHVQPLPGGGAGNLWLCAECNARPERHRLSGVSEPLLAGGCSLCDLVGGRQGSWDADERDGDEECRQLYL